MYLAATATLFAATFFYLFHLLFYTPYIVRRHMLKHPNVYVSENFVPGEGDIKEVQSALNEKCQTYLTMFNEANAKRPYDIVHLSFGPYLLNGVVSVQAIEDLKRLTPSHLDRSPHEKRTIGQMFKNWFGLIPSNTTWKTRRHFIGMALANQVSEKIPLFLRTIQSKAGSYKVGERIDLLELFQRCSMSAVTNILFGDCSGAPLVPYVDSSGLSHLVSLEESYMRVYMDCDAAFKTVLNQLFPVLLDKHIGPLNRRNYNNRLAFDEGLRKFLANSAQDSTLYGRLKMELGVSEEEIMEDLKGLIFAGFDSTSRGCAGTVYRLLTNPHYLKRLRIQM